MSRELLLLRHAKSDWSIDVGDFERPLNKRGKKEAQIMGEWMRRQGLTPDWIVCSPARRALKTSEKICKAMEVKTDAIHFHDFMYQSDVKTLIKALADCPPHSERVLLIGHNPELEALLIYLADAIEQPEDGKLLATATLARLRMPDDWADLHRHCAELVSIVRAASLKEGQ